MKLGIDFVRRKLLVFSGVQLLYIFPIKITRFQPLALASADASDGRRGSIDKSATFKKLNLILFFLLNH